MDKMQILEFLFPAGAAWIINKELLSNNSKKAKNAKVATQDWNKRFGTKEVTLISKMADDLYNFEMQRLNLLARKGTSLLAAAGFVISLTSLILAFGKDWLYYAGSSLVLFFILLAVINFVASAVSASKALKISPLHLLTISDAGDILDNKVLNKDELTNQWASQKLLDVDLNYDIILTITNWLDAAQGSFLRGIYSIGFGFAILTFIIVFFPKIA